MSRTDKDAKGTVRSAPRRYFGSPPHWFINAVWEAPQRQKARLACVETVKEFRGSADVHTEPTTRQPRRCAQWLYW